MARKSRKIKKRKARRKRSPVGTPNSEERKIENLTWSKIEGALYVLKGKIISVSLSISGSHLKTNEPLYSGTITINKN